MSRRGSAVLVSILVGGAALLGTRPVIHGGGPVS